MHRAVEWFAKNPVAANLLMLLILAAGLLAAPQVKQEVFPEFSLEFVLQSHPPSDKIPRYIAGSRVRNVS